jgi:hypothetical protein
VARLKRAVCLLESDDPGAVAQLVERVLGRHEVRGSTPLSSTAGHRLDSRAWP